MPTLDPNCNRTTPVFSGKSTTPLQHDIWCLHTMVGTTPGSLSIGAQAGHSYTHEYLDGDGDLWPGWWLDYRAAGNLEGNWRVISTETEDVNAGIFPSPWADPPWTQAQLDKLIISGAWKCARYNIPPELIPDTKPGRRGIAYHRQGIAGNFVPYDGIVPGGERWSNAFGKICPARRVHQLKTIVIPGIQQIVWNIQPLPPEVNVMDPTVVQEPTYGKVCILWPSREYEWMNSWESLVGVVDGLEGAGIKVEYNGRKTIAGVPNVPDARAISAIAFDRFKPARPGIDDKDPNAPPS